MILRNLICCFYVILYPKQASISLLFFLLLWAFILNENQTHDNNCFEAREKKY